MIQDIFVGGFTIVEPFLSIQLFFAQNLLTIVVGSGIITQSVSDMTDGQSNARKCSDVLPVLPMIMSTRSSVDRAIDCGSIGRRFNPYRVHCLKNWFCASSFFVIYEYFLPDSKHLRCNFSWLVGTFSSILSSLYLMLY